MSKRAYISRYLLILKKLKAKPYSTYEELEEYMDNQFEQMREMDDKLEFNFSKRTWDRDKREITNLFGIDIEYSKANKGYYISQTEAENMNFQRMVEAFDMFNSLNLAEDLTPFIHLEKRKPQGTENLYGIIHAIKNKLQIRFSYHKFWEDKITERLAETYALKEFKNRWYMMAKDMNDNHIKSFALDRLSDLEITKAPFKHPKTYDIEESFRYAFGIINPDNEKPQEIILIFNPFQGKYIKSLPLHETQKILLDNDKILKIKLTLCITHDFIMELLSFGNNVRVEEPESLVEKIKNEHYKAFYQY